MHAKHALYQLSYIPEPLTGDIRNRTGDLMHAKHALYQLSYIPS
jgi:hypothetical protein